MKTFTSIALTAAVAAPLVAASDFVRVDLCPPLNWMPGSYLFPGRIYAGYHSDDTLENSSYTIDTWAEYILIQCAESPGCTSTVSFQGMTS